MSDWWNAPTSKHAYLLSLVSVVITLLAAGGGIAIYFVSDEEIQCFISAINQSCLRKYMYACPSSFTRIAR